MKKKLAVLLLFTGLILIGIQSCSKYPDGPMISFNSRESRLSNTWKVDNYKINEIDYTSLFTGYTETFSEDGNYSFSWGSIAGTGKWAFQNNDLEIRVTGVDNQSSETLYILKLEEKQLWYYFMDGTDRKEFHMVQQ